MDIKTKSEPLFLALDIGTSSVRAGLYTKDAQLLTNSIVQHSRHLDSTKEGGFEIDANEAFEQVVAVIDELVASSAVTTNDIKFGAISSFWHSIVGVDSHGSPTTKLFGWAEMRPAKYVADLKRDFDQEEIRNRTGCSFHSSYWPAKLLWLKNEFTEEYTRTSKWLSFSDFVGLRLFDSDNTSFSMASGTGLFDIRKQEWDQPLFDYLEISQDSLPPISADKATARLNTEYAKRWEGLKDVNWFPAIGDGAANNIGAGCLTRSKAVLMVGTSGAMRVAYQGEPPDKIPAGLWCYLVDSKRVVVGGAISDGGGLYHWLRETFRIELDDTELEIEIAKRPAAGHGLVFLPFLAGERSTGYNDYATGSILGLKTATDSIDIVQAAFESVAFRFAEVLEGLSRVLEIDEIIASGGALEKSSVWTQIICDTFGKEITLAGEQEASSKGAVILASMAAGFYEQVSSATAEGAKVFRPEFDKNKAYNEARKMHQKFYSLLVESV